jgi:pSer/pThr/pTyr-binding forkhead associated (FHA) protein
MRAPKLYALYKLIHPGEYTIETDTIMIGRSAICQIVVPLIVVSGVHARIEWDSSHYVLYDTKSLNGTFVNGQRIEGAYILKNQDLIGLSTDRPLLRFENPIEG